MKGCCLCGATLNLGAAVLFRVNEKGVPGVYACERHIQNFPEAKPDPEVQALVDAIRGKA